ncbi:unnamed protein product [Oncorhynchus mykiss]|uniref:UBX domain-containing protein 4 n=1 Tax=Oncorhynchus mykiss TaxID=8022 RepID=A0A060WWV0_ONCMY|nr:unnamed protein product [Oncorhynchus mykiss]
MLWFEGSIPAAIISAKEQSSIFVVVITGDDEVSAQIMSSWEDDRVAEVSHNCCVAIKVDAKSETCSQFSQIYPVVCIPSSFFIGENGIPLEVVAGSVSAEELMKRIDKVKQMHAQQIASKGAEAGTPVEACLPAVVASEPAPAQPPSPPLELQPSHAPPAAPATPKESLSRPAEEGGASASVVVTPGEDGSASSDDASTSSQPDRGLDAKVERLTKKLEERRDQKKKEEEVKNTDTSPTDTSLVSPTDTSPTDTLLMSPTDTSPTDTLLMSPTDTSPTDTSLVITLKKTLFSSSAIARIQFRLPDGSFFTRQFSSEARLNEARQFAVNEVGNRYGNFSLATMFPRREFTADDLGKTLLELELAPGASIVLLPQTGRPNNTVVQSGGGIWAVLGTILYPLLAVWRFLSGFLFTSPATPGAAGPRGPAQQPNTTSGSGSSSSSAEPKRETLRKRTLEKQPVDFKRDGKIHRLRNHQDSEDENNTWNGNSTQQM